MAFSSSPRINPGASLKGLLGEYGFDGSVTYQGRDYYFQVDLDSGLVEVWRKGEVEMRTEPIVTDATLLQTLGRALAQFDIADG